jgi:hypothetical protein
MTESEFMAMKSRPKMTENEFMDTCTVMCMNGIGSLEEVLEMPCDMWFDAQKSLMRVLERQSESVKYAKSRL